MNGVTSKDNHHGHLAGGIPISPVAPLQASTDLRLSLSALLARPALSLPLCDSVGQEGQKVGLLHPSLLAAGAKSSPGRGRRMQKIHHN